MVQSFKDGNVTKLDFPSHQCIFGSTMSGKTFLATTIINDIDQVYKRKMSTYTLIVLSPHEDLEEDIKSRLDEKWLIVHFNVEIFSQEVIDRMISFLAKENLLGKEIIAMVDDLLIQSTFASSADLFIVKSFATLRHQNISLIATIQNNSRILMQILQNCSYFFIMQGFGDISMLTKVIRAFLGLVNIPTLLRKVLPLLQQNKKGSFILLNLTYEASINHAFTISNSIRENIGFTKDYLIHLSLDLA